MERSRLRTRGTRPRPVSVALALIVVVGAVIRFWHLGSTALNFDESFTAMTGRLPLGSIFGFLRNNDSHPPFDYLLQLPLARAGVSPFVFRLPSVLCSIAALALFAWWMRDRGRVGIYATAAMAICAFQVVHGREARMYAPLELIGVACAVVADAWLHTPRRKYAVLVGALTFAGLMTHVSMLLLAVGLLALAGRRVDAAAWQWRGAVLGGLAAWALLWGASFLVQARGGHSSWIPHTTAARFVDTISALVTTQAGVADIVVVAICVGGIICWRRDATLARVLACCCFVPAGLAGLLGLRSPVLLDRTLTLAAWGPLLALAVAADALSRRARALGFPAAAITAVVMLASTAGAIAAPGPTAALDQLDRVARPGDVIAIQPLPKGVELDWTLAIRGDDGPTRSVQLPGIRDAAAVALTGRRPTGRVWLMQITSRKIALAGDHLCAPTWHRGLTRMFCIRREFGRRFPSGSKPSIASIYARYAAMK